MPVGLHLRGRVGGNVFCVLRSACVQKIASEGDGCVRFWAWGQAEGRGWERTPDAGEGIDRKMGNADKTDDRSSGEQCMPLL